MYCLSFRRSKVKEGLIGLRVSGIQSYSLHSRPLRRVPTSEEALCHACRICRMILIMYPPVVLGLMVQTKDVDCPFHLAAQDGNILWCVIVMSKAVRRSHELYRRTPKITESKVYVQFNNREGGDLKINGEPQPPHVPTPQSPQRLGIWFGKSQSSAMLNQNITCNANIATTERVTQFCTPPVLFNAQPRTT